MFPTPEEEHEALDRIKVRLMRRIEEQQNPKRPYESCSNGCCLEFFVLFVIAIAVWAFFPKVAETAVAYIMLFTQLFR